MKSLIADAAGVYPSNLLLLHSHTHMDKFIVWMYMRR